MTCEGDSARAIVGSAEPLTPEERAVRLRELADWGVDLSLVWASLQRTPTERVIRMLDHLELVRELRRGYARQQTLDSNEPRRGDH
ncbi:MAG: hypothetical protein ACR2PL_22515 [Dehalococcoidia bacterium]